MGAVEVRAKRILSHIKNIEMVQDFEINNLITKYGLAPERDEKIICLYRDNNIDNGSKIIFTDKKIIRIDFQGIYYIKYEDIEHSEPPNLNQVVHGFFLIMKNKTRVWLPVSGRVNNRFYDAFEVIRFIDRVLTDISV